MKILHISDLHLGKIVNGFSMLEDQEYILNQICCQVKSEAINTVVIAGDIYDRAIAPVDAINIWDNFLNNLVNLDVDVLIINGNHDSMKRLNYASKLLEKSKIRIVSSDVLFKKIEIGDVDFYLLPFLDLEQAKILIDKPISDFTTLKQEIVGHISLDSGKTNIIIDHSYIITGEHDLEVDSAIRPLAIGGSEFTAGSVYEKFDLVLAGHIHRHSHIKPNIYYSGSILPYSIGEANNNNGYYIHEITDVIKSEYHQFELLHKMRKIEMYIADIATHSYSQDYVAVKLLDQGQVLNPLEKIRTKYPNVMQIERQDRQIEIEMSVQSNQLSLVENFAQFYNLNHEHPIEQPALDLFNEIVMQVTKGEYDETN